MTAAPQADDQGRANVAEAPPVTATRKFPLKFSSSRNAGAIRTIAPDSCDWTDVTPDACHWCREPFRPGRMRYPILGGVSHSGGWGIASVCMDCFKAGHDDESIVRDSITRLNRPEQKCAGCGEPILTVTAARAGCWYVCSNRCYQRAYRKRRRVCESVIDWKARIHSPRCEACSRPLGASRRDAKFCSSRCRQWHYRRRHAGEVP